MAYDALILKGTTSQMFEVMIRDATTGQGKTGVAFGSVAARYQREGAAASAAVTVVSASLGTFTSGGWVEVDATNCPGLYQFGAPNAALASGANAVTFMFKVSGAIDKTVRIVLTGAVDFAAAAGGTNAAIPFGSGVGQLNVATGRVDVGKLNGSSNAALYLQRILDSILLPTATATGTTTSRTFTLDSALANASADLVGAVLRKTSGKPFVGVITGYTTGGGTARVDFQPPATGQPALDGSEVYEIVPDVRAVLTSTLAVTAGSLAAQAQTDVQSAMTAQGYTTVRATNLANLDVAVSSRMASGNVTVGAFAANAITAASIAAGALNGKGDWLLAASYVAPDNTTITAIAGYLDTEIAAIKLVTDHVATAIELDGSVYRFTTNALELAPTGSGGGGGGAAPNIQVDFTEVRSQ